MIGTIIAIPKAIVQFVLGLILEVLSLVFFLPLKLLSRPLGSRARDRVDEMDRGMWSWFLAAGLVGGAMAQGHMVDGSGHFGGHDGGGDFGGGDFGGGGDIGGFGGGGDIGSF